MAIRPEDLTGQKFTKLLVESMNGRKNGKIYWNCICDCGNKRGKKVN